MMTSESARPAEQDPTPAETTLEAAFQAHRGRLEGVIRSRMPPALAARVGPDDILTETYLTARRKWANFAASGMTPYVWLYRIACDCLGEARRREYRALRTPERELAWPEHSSRQIAFGLIDSLTSPSGQAVRMELQDRLRLALDRLREADREVIWMRHLDELTSREISLLLGISEEAAMKRYARALMRLKNAWQDMFEGEGEDQ